MIEMSDTYAGNAGSEGELTDLNIDIRLPVANNRRMILLMNRDRSLIFFVGLSSVSRSLRVSSSKSEVRISTVNDSAKNV